MAPEELMALSKAYNEHKGEIDALILKQIRRGEKSKSQIARDFGLHHSAISLKAKKAGLR